MRQAPQNAGKSSHNHVFASSRQFNEKGVQSYNNKHRPAFEKFYRTNDAVLLACLHSALLATTSYAVGMIVGIMNGPRHGFNIPKTIIDTKYPTKMIPTKLETPCLEGEWQIEVHHTDCRG